MDDSSGPLLVDYLWRQGKLSEHKFGILSTFRTENVSSIELGSYDKLG